MCSLSKTQVTLPSTPVFLTVVATTVVGDLEDFVGEVFRLTLARESIQVAKFLVGGEPAEYRGSLFQPEWSPDGSALFYVSDQSGWWNIYRYDLHTKATRCITSMQAEFARAQWNFGMSMYAFAGADRMVAAYMKDGLTSLARLDLRSGQFIKLDQPYTEISSVRAEAQGRVPLLAPDIVQAILNGRPPQLRLEKLLRRLPLDWVEQRAQTLSCGQE